MYKDINKSVKNQERIQALRDNNIMKGNDLDKAIILHKLTMDSDILQGHKCR